MKRVGSIVVASLVGLLLMPAISQSSTLLVPKTPWPVCSSTIVEFCIESVSIQSPGQAVEQLTWVPSGNAAPSSSASSSTSTTTTTLPGSTTTPTTTTTVATSSTTSQSSTPLAGMWTDATWSANGHAALGFSGLYVEANAANVFSNFMVFNVLPTLQDPASNDVFLANQSGSNYPASLSPDDIVTVSVETGNAQPGVTMAIGNNFSDIVSTDANGSVLTFSASPVPVAVASNTSQCVGESGVAAAQVTQLQAIVAPTNDPNAGFGVDGVSGRMYVESNGACVLSTPVWDVTTQTLTWTVGAPHFLPDGTTINQGFYQAMIPGADATLLWGLTNINQAASALVVSETSSGGASSQIAESSVSVKGGNIFISATGFSFSSPKFKISKNPRYKHFTTKKPRTITCERGKQVKKVTSPSPRCPRGFHVK